MVSSVRAMVAIVLFTTALVTSKPASAQHKPEELAQQSSEVWLALTDGGKYADSYNKPPSTSEMPSRTTSGRTRCTPSATLWARCCREKSRARRTPRRYRGRRTASMS